MHCYVARNSGRGGQEGLRVCAKGLGKKHMDFALGVGGAIKRISLNLCLLRIAYEHPDIFPADYWSVSVVDRVSLCFIPSVSMSSCIQSCPFCSLIFAISNTWHTEVMNSRLRHSCHCLLVPSSRNLVVTRVSFSGILT